jgi:hypothetical protein
MMTSKRRWLFAIAVALYLYFLLPATATMFYELYHLTHIDPIYWGYSGFKAAGYYFGTYEYRLLASGLAGIAIAFIPVLVKTVSQKVRG